MEHQTGRKPAGACAVVSTNRNSRITGWSGEAEALYGWAEGEAKGRNIDELLRAEYAGGGFDVAFSSLLAYGWVDLEAEHEAKGGERFGVSDTVSLLRAGSGEITGMVHVLRPLGAAGGREGRAEEKLGGRDRELLDLLIGTADDLWVYDLPRDAQQTGLAPKGAAEADGEATAGMVHPDDWERVDAAIRDAMADKREWFRVQCRTLSANGEYLWSLTQGKIRYDEAGRPVRLSGMTIGISEIKNLEAQLESQAKALERQALEAKDRDRQAAEFISNMSHELKTPLSVMLMDLQRTERRLRDIGAGDDALLRTVAAARRNALRILRLIGNLLDITRIEAGALKARLVNADVVEAVSGVVGSVKPYAKSAGIEMEFESSRPSRTIPLDADKLERILMNLLSNSIRHTKPGGHILVRLRDAPDFVAISVRDDGDGMAEELKDAVFDRLKLANLRSSRVREGCGLGLPLAHALVGLLRGRIWFESEPGKGCEFFVALPVLQPDWQAPPLETDALPRERRVEMELSGIGKVV
jgi:PAS domain S-box-containing protein